MAKTRVPAGYKDLMKFPFIEALTGRRSRRFFMGAEIPEGAFAYKSKHEMLPLTEFEKLLVLTAVAKKKFGPGGPYHIQTPGPWKNTETVRGSAQVHDEDFQACVALQAEYILWRFGKFPGTVPTILVFIYLQAHHLDLEFYDHYFREGAYLRTHAEHMAKWH